MIKAGDVVFHKPSEEEWFVLGVCESQDKLCVAGWPPTIADVSDCEFREHSRPVTADEIDYRTKTFGSNFI